MCKKEKRIAFLIGAGFSVPAGMPTANELNSTIKATIYDSKRNSFKDEEDGILQSYILEKVLIDSEESVKDFNYEKYFDSLECEKKNKMDEDRLLSFIESGMYSYFWKQSRGTYVEAEEKSVQIIGMLEETLNQCEDYEDTVKGIMEWYQRIIAENVKGSTSNGKIDQFNPCYKGFAEILSYYVNQGYILDIYTLNHDLLLESLLSHTALKDMVCNGFGGEVRQIKKKKYKTFDVKYFNNTIRIYKLHGSIDIHDLYNDMSGKLYIQILDGYSDENAFLVNKTESVGFFPLFLTGKMSKEKKYIKEPFCSMLKEFEKNLGVAERLIVIGYSGNDDHINDILYKKYNQWNNTFVIGPDADKHLFVREKHAKPLNKGIESLSIYDIKLQ